MQDRRGRVIWTGFGAIEGWTWPSCTLAFRAAAWSREPSIFAVHLSIPRRAGDPTLPSAVIWQRGGSWRTSSLSSSVRPTSTAGSWDTTAYMKPRSSFAAQSVTGLKASDRVQFLSYQSWEIIFVKWTVWEALCIDPGKSRYQHALNGMTQALGKFPFIRSRQLPLANYPGWYCILDKSFLNTANQTAPK